MNLFKVVLSKLLGATYYSKVTSLKRTLSESLFKKKLTQKRCDFYKSFIKHGDLCFDVGANVGNRVETFLNLGAKVIAVEPQQECIKTLERKFGNRINIVPMGLGEREEEKQFFKSSDTTLSSFNKEWIDDMKKDRFKEHDWKESSFIKLTTLDKLIAEYGEPDFIKIDVEGFELNVLKGLSMPIKMISIEYTAPEQVESTLACLDHLNSLDTGFVYNYSIGEAMRIHLQEWIGYNHMISHIKSDIFASTKFGDIYIKRKSFLLT